MNRGWLSTGQGKRFDNEGEENKMIRGVKLEFWREGCWLFPVVFCLGAAVSFGEESPKGSLPVLATVPEFGLTDQNGEVFGSKDLAGDVWIANFIFTRCPATCPQQTRHLKMLQEQLLDHPQWDRIHLVSFSVDPKNDSPEVLRAYGDAAGADHARWHFLTGRREKIWGLSKDGFKLDVGEAPPDGNSPLFHSPKLVLLDASCRMRGLYDGLSQDGLDDLQGGLALLFSEESVDGKPAPSGDNPVAAKTMYRPSTVKDVLWLNRREKEQLETVDEFDVFTGFSYSDELVRSGIDFCNRVVDDAAKTYKASHYDHGNGVAVADVDMDGLYDIYFCTQVGSNQLWRNLGGGKFENITADAGADISLDDRIGVSASFADTDNDGDPDLYATSILAGNLLFENDGKGRFLDITDKAGVGYKGHSSSADFFDYDRDGKLDLFLTNVGKYTYDEVRSVINDATTRKFGEKEYFFNSSFQDAFAGHLKPERFEQSLLFKNMGGNQFSNVTEQVGVMDVSWSGDASAVDVNEDGWLDLYVLNMQGHDEYYENVKGESFVKKSREVFPATPWGAMGIKAFDYDNDGHMDIYITDMHSDMSQPVQIGFEKHKSKMKWPESLLDRGGSPSIYGNAFYRSRDGRMEEISDRIGAENYWPWGLSVGDVNSDGFEDAFLTSSMNCPFRYGVNSLLLNNRGRAFLDSEFVLGVEPRRDRRTATPWFELDCSGEDKGHDYCSGKEGRYVVWGSLGSRSSAIFDLDNDGDLDIVVNEFNTEPLILVSNLASQKDIHFLSVKLVGSKSNRDGLGSRVVVYTGSGVYTKVHDGQSGYLSQSLCPLYFGLGEAAAADRIEVFWASGGKQIVEGPIKANRLVVVSE